MDSWCYDGLLTVTHSLTHFVCATAGTCWINRDDVTPTTKQKPEPGGRAGVSER